MSGRVKHAPATPEQEREQIRQLTRELHEAAQAAREAIREYRAAREEIERGVEKRIQALLDVHAGHINGQVKKETDGVLASIRKVGRAVEDKYSELLGFQSSDELQEYIAGQFIAQIHSTEFVEKIAERITWGNNGTAAAVSRRDWEAYIATHRGIIGTVPGRDCP